MLAVYSLPPYAPAAGPPRRPGRRAAAGAGLGSGPPQQRLLLGLAFAGAALLEWAWLNDRPDRAAAVLEAWAPHAARPGAEQATAELLRYAARAGLPVEAFPGCPQPWAAGLRGDWRPRPRRWAEIGDPYERALELADSGEVGADRWRRCARWRTSARTPRPGWSAGSCARSGSPGCRGAATPAPGPTRPG